MDPLLGLFHRWKRHRDKDLSAAAPVPGLQELLGAEWGREGMGGSAVPLTCPLSPVPVPASPTKHSIPPPAVESISHGDPRLNFCLSWEFLLQEIMLKSWQQGQGLAAFPGTSISSLHRILRDGHSARMLLPGSSPSMESIPAT